MNRYAVQVRSRASEPVGRWLWLVKWLLLIPHYLVLAVLWVAFAALTLIAAVAVLVTGRYPAAIFAFNVGVLRWSWRVGFYGYQVLGTDRYPPFTLAEVPDYPAGLVIDGPPRLPRWLPLVAWLLALPHLLILGVATGTAGGRLLGDAGANAASIGLIGVLVLIVAISLTVRGRAPQGLHDLLVGGARWSLRVVSYVALLTPQYPPFRLDQGDTEPPVDGIGRPHAADTRPVSQRHAPATVPAGRIGVAGRVTAVTVGVLLLLAAAGIGIGGIGVLTVAAARDTDGYVTSRALDIDSPTGAVTAENLRIQTDDVWSQALVDFGRIRITASDPADTSLFIGIARQADVDRWLAGTAHDQLVDSTTSGDVRYDRTAGEIRDVTAPGDQVFWLAATSGTGTVVLDWQVSDGDFAIVLANATGAPGITATSRIATRVPDPTGLGLGLLGGALPFAVLAFALIYLGATDPGRRQGPPPAADVAGPDAPTGPDPVGDRALVDASARPHD